MSMPRYLLVLMDDDSDLAAEAISLACAEHCSLFSPSLLHVAVVPSPSAQWMTAAKWEPHPQQLMSDEDSRQLALRQVEQLLDQLAPDSIVDLFFLLSPASLSVTDADPNLLSLAMYHAVERCRDKSLNNHCFLVLRSPAEGSAHAVDEHDLPADGADSLVKCWSRLLNASIVELPFQPTARGELHGVQARRAPRLVRLSCASRKPS